MTDNNVQVPHFSLPFRVGVGGTFATVEQDSDEDILQGVVVLVGTPLGRQVELPDYGVPELVFQERPDMNAIIDAVDLWQPRASVNPYAVIDSLDELVQHVQIEVSNA